METTLSTSKVYKENVGLRFYKLVHRIMALIIIVWLNTGIFEYIAPYYPNYLRYGTFLFWFLLAIIFNRHFLIKFIKKSWILLLFTVYIIFVYSINDEAYIMNDFRVLIYLVMIYSILLYYLEPKFKKFAKKIAIVLLVDISFIAFNTYRNLIENPLIARIITTESAAKRSLDTLPVGVGGYEFFYALVPIILLFFYLFITYKKYRLLNLILTIILTVILIKASFTMAILFTLGFMMTFVLLRIIKRYWFIVFFFITGLIVLFAQGVLVNILNKIAYTDGVPDVISVRFIELSSFLTGNHISGGDLDVRLELYTSSIKAFLHNFFVGTSIPFNANYTAGGHSTWLDLLANYGLVAIPFLLFIFTIYKHIKNNLKREFNLFIKIYWLYFVCLGFVNTLFFPAIFVSWFLFIPFFIMAYSDRFKAKEAWQTPLICYIVSKYVTLPLIDVMPSISLVKKSVLAPVALIFLILIRSFAESKTPNKDWTFVDVPKKSIGNVK